MLERSRFYRWALGALAAPVALWVIYQGLTWGLRNGSNDSAATFEAVRVERGDFEEQVIGTGATKPVRLVVIQSEIPGVVAAVHVDDGDRVARGDKLVELDRARLEHHVAELSAALAMAQAEARIDVVGRAEVELRHAKHEHDRVSRLFEQNVASPEELERAGHVLELAQIAQSDAVAEIAARRAAVEKAAAALRRAEKDLEKAVIQAPIDGVVVRREVEVGNAVTDLEHGGTVIAVLADDRRIHVLAEIDENDIAGVRVGQGTEVRIDAFPDEVFEGEVRKVSLSGAGDGRLANFEVEIGLDPDPRFRIGMSADVRITLRRHEAVLLVPNSSILRTRGGPAVRLATDGGSAYELVSIRERYSNGFQTVIDSAGLSEGDRLLVVSRTP